MEDRIKDIEALTGIKITEKELKSLEGKTEFSVYNFFCDKGLALLSYDVNDIIEIINQ